MALALGASSSFHTKTFAVQSADISYTPAAARTYSVQTYIHAYIHAYITCTPTYAHTPRHCVCACMRGFLWVGRVFNGWKAFAPCSRCLPRAPPPPPLLPHWSLCCRWPSSGERVDHSAFISSTASNSIRKQKSMIAADLTRSVKCSSPEFTVNSQVLTYVMVQCERFSGIYCWEYRLE